MTKKCCRSLRREKKEKWCSPGNPNTDIWKLRKAWIQPCRNEVFTAEATVITMMRMKRRKVWRYWPTVPCTVPVRQCMWKVLLICRNRIQPMCFPVKIILSLCWTQIIRKWGVSRYVPMNSVRLPPISHYLRPVWTECFLWRREKVERISVWRIINVRHSILRLKSKRKVTDSEMKCR